MAGVSGVSSLGENGTEFRSGAMVWCSSLWQWREMGQYNLATRVNSQVV